MPLEGLSYVPVNEVRIRNEHLACSTKPLILLKFIFHWCYSVCSPTMTIFSRIYRSLKVNKHA